MPRKTWTFIDTAHDVFIDEVTITPADVGQTTGNFSLRKRVLRGGLRDGLNVVELDNGCLRATILCDRGMGLWRIWQGDLELGWPSPVKGPVHPKFVPLDEATGIGWLNGFDELLCRCGLESNGPPEWSDDGKLRHTLHGRIANCPAHLVEATIDGDRGEMSVSGVVDEARLFGNKLRLRSTARTEFGSSKLTIVDEISNPWAEPADLELLYHINLGPPLAAPGSRFDAPVAVVAPRDAAAVAAVESWHDYPSARPGTPETVLYMQLAADENDHTGVLLSDPQGNRGLSLSFDREQFPYFALWKNSIALGDGYCTGLEPCLNFPNMKSFEQVQGRVARVAPDETRRFELELEIHSDAASIERARQRVARIQAGVQPRFFREPRPEWSPGV